MDNREIQKIITGKDLDILIAERVFKWVYDTRNFYWHTPDGGGRLLPSFSRQISAAWEIVEYFIKKMGYDNGLLLFAGPIFKPAHQYMTQEGFPLGITCWYVEAETPNGHRKYICGETAPLAVCYAALWLTEAMAEENERESSL